MPINLGDKNHLIEALFQQQQRILFFRKQIVLHEENEEKRAFSKGAVKRIQASIAWVESNRRNIERQLGG